MLPRPYVSADTQRVTIAFFCLSALDLLGVLNPDSSVQGKVADDEKQSYRDWLWALQLSADASTGGFVGSPGHAEVAGHLAMTYAALLSLALLRDDFTRLNKDGIRSLLRATQHSDGSFQASPGSLERDPRFVFCAFAICSILDDWEAVDVGKALDFLDSCQSYDGAFGQGPHQESHGGSTYCALSAIALCGQLNERLSPVRRRRLISWLTSRQCDCDQVGHGGFNGRISKGKDSCYSFWCGASLAVLSSHHLIDVQANVTHLLGLQTVMGGIAKTADDHPDAMHSYLSLAALAISVHGGSGRRGESAALCDLRQHLPQPLEPRINLGEESLSHAVQAIQRPQSKAS
ncbi:unnamed protein product [Parajaminaea phylloscopi]